VIHSTINLGGSILLDQGGSVLLCQRQFWSQSENCGHNPEILVTNSGIAIKIGKLRTNMLDFDQTTVWRIEIGRDVESPEIRGRSAHCLSRVLFGRL
jgi:hypothetical protein